MGVRSRIHDACPCCGREATNPKEQWWYSDDEDEDGNVTAWDIEVVFECASCGYEWDTWV